MQSIINEVTKDLNEQQNVDKNQAYLLKLRLVQISIVGLVRAVKKNDFSLLAVDLESEIKKIKLFIPTIVDFLEYIVKKRNKQKTTLNVAVVEATKDKLQTKRNLIVLPEIKKSIQPLI